MWHPLRSATAVSAIPIAIPLLLSLKYHNPTHTSGFLKTIYPNPNPKGHIESDLKRVFLLQTRVSLS